METKMHQCSERVHQLKTKYDQDAECYVSVEQCPDCGRQYLLFT